MEWPSYLGTHILLMSPYENKRTQKSHGRSQTERQSLGRVATSSFDSPLSYNCSLPKASLNEEVCSLGIACAIDVAFNEPRSAPLLGTVFQVSTAPLWPPTLLRPPNLEYSRSTASHSYTAPCTDFFPLLRK